MNPEQANALLILISDLARIIYSPPLEAELVSTNGAVIKEPVATP